MDPINQNPVIPGNVTPEMPPEHHRSSVGPIAGTVIIILLLVAGGLYFWGAKLNNDMQRNPPPFIPSNDTSIEGDLSADASAGLPSQSSSDDMAAIEADANAMNMDQLNSQNSAELDGI